LTVELAAEYGVAVDRAGFDVALQEQRDRSRTGKKADLSRQAESAALFGSIQARRGDTTFLGYETTTAPARVVAIVRDGIEYDELTAKGDTEGRTGASATAEIILDQTPFYAEGGGQIGDRGVLVVIPADAPDEPWWTVREEDGRLRVDIGDGSVEPVFTVEDTQKPVGGLHVHRGTLHGTLRVGDRVLAVVDPDRRAHTMRNHTGTHLLHRALRNVVGEGARQAGSLVTPDYLRFDFPLDRGLERDELRAIEAEVRRIIRDDRTVTPSYTTMQEAIEGGADAFFDEKYGETVRTVRVEGYSHELCGGTHCRATGQIGGFVITGERSIGSGMRRIEALTGAGADAWLDRRLATLEEAAAVAGAQSPEVIAERVRQLQDELRETKRRLKAGGGAGLPKPGELAARARQIGPDIRLVSHAGAYESIDAMKAAAKDVRGALGSGVIVLALDADEPQVFVTVSDDLVARGVSAGVLVKAAVAAIGGKGGGRPEMAQGKGSNRNGIGEALAAVEAAAGAAAGSPR
jgi:alanyl-tRNA synthetase